MKIFSKFPTVNISKLNYWLVICIAKNFIWTSLKMIFSIFRLFCTLRFQYCPIITNHTSMERLFIQLSDNVYISILKYWHWWSHMSLVDSVQTVWNTQFLPFLKQSQIHKFAGFFQLVLLGMQISGGGAGRLNEALLRLHLNELSESTRLEW